MGKNDPHWDNYTVSTFLHHLRATLLPSLDLVLREYMI